MLGRIVAQMFYFGRQEGKRPPPRRVPGHRDELILLDDNLDALPLAFVGHVVDRAASPLA